MTTKTTNGIALLVVAGVVGAYVLPRDAMAQTYTVNSCDPENPAPACLLSGTPVNIQRPRAVFNFQARVSKAKLPLADALLPRVLVKLSDGINDVCVETLSNVQVKKGVLNLQIGTTDACPDLEYHIAANGNLQLKLCINDAQQCLDPISIGTVPYAVKASYAFEAQQAHVAREAAEAHYAHRITADRDFAADTPASTGYFDFYTPDSADDGVFDVLAQEGETGEDFLHAGFVTWVGTSEASNRNSVHIAARDTADVLQPLDKLVVHSSKMQIRGELEVDKELRFRDATMVGAITIDDSAESQLVCRAKAEFYSDVDFGAAGDTDQQVKFWSPVLSMTKLTAHNEVVAAANAQIDFSKAVKLDLGSGRIDTATIKDSAVTSIKIANGAVGHEDLAAGNNPAVRAVNILNGAVTGEKIAQKSIGSGHIVDGSITSADIEDGTIKGEDIKGGEIGTDQLADNAITSAKIKDREVKSADIAEKGVTSFHLADHTIVDSDLASEAVSNRVIKKKTITANELSHDIFTSVSFENITVFNVDGTVSSTKREAEHKVSASTYGLCVLTAVRVQTQDAGSFRGCRIVREGGYWKLTAQAGELNTSRAYCEMTCFKF